LKYFIFFLAVCLVACTSAETRKQDAIKEITADASANAKLFSSELSPLAPKVDVIQITYGQDSLKNIDFLNFLANSKAKLSSIIIDKLKTQQNEYSNALKKEKSDQAFISETIATARSDIAVDIKLSKKLNMALTLNLTGANLSQALEQISKRGNININNKVADVKLQGRYSGTISNILQTLAKENNFMIYRECVSSSCLDTIKSGNGEGLVMTSSKDATLNLLDFDSLDINTIFLVQKDLDILNKKYLEIFSKESKEDVQLNIQDASLDLTLKTNRVINLLEAMISQLQINTLAKEKNKELSVARNLIINESANASEQATKKTTNAIYKPTTIEGEEIIIEKFSVYNQTPDDLKKIIEAYGVFKTGNCTTAETKVAPLATGATATGAAATATGAAATGATGAAATGATGAAATGATGAAATGAAATGAAATGAAATGAAATATCVKLTLDKDATGIIASGSINDIKLVEKFIDDQDSSVKQVLIEVYILEMIDNWATKLDSRLSRTTQTAGTPAATTIIQGLTGASLVAGGVSIDTRFGAKNDINYLIKLVETNSLGKNISNPSILVKDGATGVVDKTRTVKERVDTVTLTNGVSSTATAWNDLASPLTLTVKPKINKHNDNIDLDFSFIETKRDLDAASSPTTANKITTNLLVEPGKVIVMAGLRTGVNSIDSNGLPGFARLGLSPILAPLIALVGGERNQIKNSTELLVIINPSVITSKNIERTIDRVTR
jgi:type II secretory pathway component GspD/PulD (secretin)